MECHHNVLQGILRNAELRSPTKVITRAWAFAPIFQHPKICMQSARQKTAFVHLLARLQPLQILSKIATSADTQQDCKIATTALNLDLVVECDLGFCVSLVAVNRVCPFQFGFWTGDC